MRIVNQTSLNRLLKPGEAPDCVTPEEIAAHTVSTEQRALSFLSAWQLPAPRQCEFVVTLGYERKPSASNGPEVLRLTGLWPRVWLVAPRRAPDLTNAVCVADLGWGRLIKHLSGSVENDAETALRALLKDTIRQGIAEQCKQLAASEKLDQERVDFDKYLRLRLEDVQNGVVVPTQ